MDKFTHIKVPILNDEYWITVCWGDWGETAKKYIRSITEPNMDFGGIEASRAMFYASTNFSFMPVILMCIPLKDKHFFSSLAHESVHVINELWKHLEEPSKEEVFAYSVGAIVYAVERQVRK